ncbi:ANTAR domain-containing protein [Arthrobacter sp. BB-1]|uniref:ANTAR domain-containing protein n=1 Tax=unclassified Arthrobacter TaxID=235627 RepID=UPI0010F4200E|nr:MULTISPECIES: ANTAR domain-containing protein [unclassified Arthrobacter]TNB70474.1 ANTAR domain-containing protein [Arthrobacter sp. BB-1]VII97377.1 putative GAF sensor protein [Arthrobacter sp. DR-2P]
MAAHPATDGRRQDRPGFLLDLITGTETELDSLQRLTEAAANAVNGQAGSGMDCAAVLARGGTTLATAGSSSAAAEMAASEDRYGDGPLMQALSTAGAVTVDGDTSVRWRAYRRRLVASGYGRAVAVPLGLAGGTSCALVFLGRTGTGFPEDLLAEAKWFAGVATHSMRLALEVRNVRSAGDNLKSVLESRTSIDVACGVIMAQNRCTYPEAFIKLASASRQRNLKVRSVAENILKALPSGAPAARFEF